MKACESQMRADAAEAAFAEAVEATTRLESALALSEKSYLKEASRAKEKEEQLSLVSSQTKAKSLWQVTCASLESEIKRQRIIIDENAREAKRQKSAMDEVKALKLKVLSLMRTNASHESEIKNQSNRKIQQELILQRPQDNHRILSLERSLRLREAQLRDLKSSLAKWVSREEQRLMKNEVRLEELASRGSTREQLTTIEIVPMYQHKIESLEAYSQEIANDLKGMRRQVVTMSNQIALSADGMGKMRQVIDSLERWITLVCDSILSGDCPGDSFLPASSPCVRSIQESFLLLFKDSISTFQEVGLTPQEIPQFLQDLRSRLSQLSSV